MKRNDNNEQKTKIDQEIMDINWEQQKVLSNPLRSRIVALLYEQAMTPKQVSDLLDKNPGTVYYHIQQLVKHDILEVESVNTAKGIVEKSYKAKARTFRNPEKESPAGYVDGASTNIYLSKSLLDQLSEELKDLFFKYGHLSFKEKDSKEQTPYSIEYLIKEYQGGEKE